MYLKYFKMREEPFSTAPDPRFLYRSAIHQEALERLVTSVTMRRGINAIIGEPGLGKSTLVRTMLSGLHDTVNFAWIFNTTMNSAELLRYICRDFGFVAKSQDKSDILIELYTFLIREFDKGKIPLLIIDEAQNLTPQVLEEIRQMSNLETMNRKLVQIILSGQPQLDDYLEMPQLQQLKQRISLKAMLSRFKYEDTEKYIMHRLTISETPDIDIFTQPALKSIYEITDGIPRLINQLCDNALLRAAQRRQKRIDAVLVQELIEKGIVMKAPPLPRPVHLEPMEPEVEEQPQKTTDPKPIKIETRLNQEEEHQDDVIDGKSLEFGFIEISDLISVL